MQFLDLDRPSAALIYTSFDAARRDDHDGPKTKEARSKASNEANKENERKRRVVRRPERHRLLHFSHYTWQRRRRPGPLLLVRAADLPATRSAMRQQRLLPPPLARAVSTVRSRTFYIRSPLLSRLADHNAGTLGVHIWLNVRRIVFQRHFRRGRVAPSYRKS